jgi:transposase-like protein
MTNVVTLPSGGGNEEMLDSLDAIAREGARRMIAAALRAEADEYVDRFSDERDEDGHRLVVRNGRARERKVTVGSGTIPIKAPRVNDKRVDEDGERQKFSSRILPAYARRSPKVGEVIPILYLRGLSTGDFKPALEQLLGEDAAGLSATTISRMCKEWEEHHDRFCKRHLGFSRYAYLYLDGIHVSVRLGEDPKVCLLIVIGVREDGEKGAPRGRGRLPREHRVLGGRVSGHEAPRAARAQARRRRRRAGRLGRAARRLPRRG